MGDYYDFKCEKCDFITRCSHGRDRGYVVIMQPLYCSKCKVLKNIHIGNYLSDKTEATGYKIEDVQPVCGDCSESQYLHPWDGKTCPRCGNTPLLMRDTLICWD